MDELKEFSKVKSKEVLLEGCKINEHAWSPFFDSPQGLTRQCLRCGKTEYRHFYKGRIFIDPPLKDNGFLDTEKLDKEINMKVIN